MARGPDPSQTPAHLTGRLPEMTVSCWCKTISVCVTETQSLSCPLPQVLSQLPLFTRAFNSRHRMYFKGDIDKWTFDQWADLWGDLLGEPSQTRSFQD